ncbi:hypothetical protein ACVME8_002994 [Bradyrhizobium diazoefficiens]
MDFSRTELFFLAALGAVAAAIITGAFTLTTLIVSKEDKITDSRQKWLEGLREEMAKFLGTIDTLLRFVEPQVKIKRAELKERHDYNDEQLRQIGFDDKEISDLRQSHKELYTNLNEMRLRVLLRLDPEDTQKDAKYGRVHQALISNVNQLAGEFYGPCADLEKVREHQSLILVLTQKVIDHTWNRVKGGERWFRRIRRGFLIVVLSMFVVIVAALALTWSRLSSPSLVSGGTAAGKAGSVQVPARGASGPSATQPPAGNAAGQSSAPIGGAKP